MPWRRPVKMEANIKIVPRTNLISYRCTINQLSHLPRICCSHPFQKSPASVLHSWNTDKTNLLPKCIPKRINDLCGFEKIYDQVQYLDSLPLPPQAQTYCEMLDHYPYVTLVANPFDESVSTSVFFGNSHSNISVSCTCNILCVDVWRNDWISIQRAIWSCCVNCCSKFDKYELEDPISMTFGPRFHVNTRSNIMQYGKLFGLKPNKI